MRMNELRIKKITQIKTYFYLAYKIFQFIYILIGCIIYLEIFSGADNRSKYS